MRRLLLLSLLGAMCGCGTPTQPTPPPTSIGQSNATPGYSYPSNPPPQSQEGFKVQIVGTTTPITAGNVGTVYARVDNAKGPVTYQWSVSDGFWFHTTLSGIFIHTYVKEGDNKVTVEANDGYTSSTDFTIVNVLAAIPLPKPPPIVTPYVSFYASPSSSPHSLLFNVTVVGFMFADSSWAFGDGTDEGHGAAQLVLHSYPSGGTYEVSLVAYDTGGKTYRVSEVVNVP